MSENLFFERLRAGGTFLGLGFMYPAPGIIEGMGNGWDFIWIDGQHGQISYDTALAAVQVCRGAGLETLLRVPGQADHILGTFADLAPSAIMVPMVNTAAQAVSIVDSICFPPLGSRSYGGRRVIDLYGRGYYRDRETMIVAQIETLEAAENAEAIIQTEGIDALFFGPDDMKARMDIPINTPPVENEKLLQAMEHTAKVARAAGKFAGTVATTPQQAPLLIDMGYQILVGGGDIAFLRKGSSEQLGKMRKAINAGNTDVAGDDAGMEVYGG